MGAENIQLYQIADELSLKWWGVKFDGVIEIKNRRWKNVNGRFCAPVKVPWGEDFPSLIQMCKRRNAERTTEEIRRTLLHELVHWRLFTSGVPHRDTEPEFVKEALRVGASISGSAKAKRAFDKHSEG